MAADAGAEEETLNEFLEEKVNEVDNAGKGESEKPKKHPPELGEAVTPEEEVEFPSIKVPIDEAAEFFYAWEGAKGADLRKALFKAHFRERAYERWVEKFYKAYQEAKRRGEKYVIVPPVSGIDHGDEDIRYYREMWRALGPVIAMRYLPQANGGMEKPSETIKAAIEATKEFGSNNDSIVGRLLDHTENEINALRQEIRELQNGNSNNQYVEIKRRDGNVVKIPANIYLFEVLNEKSTGGGPSNDNKLTTAMFDEVTKLRDTVDRLSRTVEELSNPLSYFAKLKSQIDEVESVRRAVFGNPSGSPPPHEAVEIEKERTKQKIYEAIGHLTSREHPQLLEPESQGPDLREIMNRSVEMTNGATNSSGEEA